MGDLVDYLEQTSSTGLRVSMGGSVGDGDDADHFNPPPWTAHQSAHQSAHPYYLFSSARVGRGLGRDDLLFCDRNNWTLNVERLALRLGSSRNRNWSSVLL